MMDLRTVSTGLLSLTLASAPVAQGFEAVKAAPAAAAVPGGKAAVFTQQVSVAVGSLHGRVLSPGTRAPISAHPLQVLDAKGASVAKLTTDASGEYATPALEAGRYQLQVRGDMRIDLVVATDATIRTLDLVVPATPETQDPKVPPAAPGGAAVSGAAAPAGGIGVGGVALAGAGATLAVGGTIAASGGGGGETTVSPAGEKARR